MSELDPNVLVTAAAGGLGVWAAIRVEIAALRRDVDRILNKVFP